MEDTLPQVVPIGTLGKEQSTNSTYLTSLNRGNGSNKTDDMDTALNTGN
jgi:hypothetical protein